MWIRNKLREYIGGKMSEDVLVPDEYIIDFSLTKEEREKKGKEYEDACNEAFKKLGLLEDKKEKINMLSDFYKKNKNDKIWWINDLDSFGKHMFSFDKIKIFNLFADYPYNLTPEEKEIFDKENPYWKEFFKERIK